MEGPHTHKFVQVPQTHQRVSTSCCNILTCGIEFDADAVCRMCVESLYLLQFRVAENVDAAMSVCEKEEVVCVVPRYLIHFKLELFLCYDLVRAAEQTKYKLSTAE